MKCIFKSLFTTTLAFYSAFAIAIPSECPSIPLLKSAQLIDGKTMGQKFGYVAFVTDEKERTWWIDLTLENRNLPLNAAQQYYSKMSLHFLTSIKGKNIICIFDDAANMYNSLTATYVSR